MSILFLGLLSGCDNNTVDPYGNRADTYSIYGYLAENRNLQILRIKRMDRPLSNERDSIDATVRLDNLTDGGSTILRDSMVAFEDQNSTVITHNFWTDASIQPRTRYRLTVEHPDGETTEATTVTPASVEAIATPDSGYCPTPFTVKFPPIEEPRRARAAVVFDVYDPVQEKVVTVSHEQEDHFQVGPDGSVFFRFRLEDLEDCDRIVSERIRIYYTYLGPEWYQDIPMDSIDAGPLKSPYIDNGKGYFGSLWRDRVVVIFLDPATPGR